VYKIRGERRVEGLVEGVPDSSKQMHHKQMNGSMALTRLVKLPAYASRYASLRALAAYHRSMCRCSSVGLIAAIVIQD